LKELLPVCDLVIVVDYDHGLITPKIVDMLSAEAPFLAVNTQVNAANIGFHSITKYKRADFICANENEIRMDRRNRNGDLHILMQELSKKMTCPALLITRGSNGTLFYRNTEGFTTCPSFAVKVIDRMGAGDAVLAIASVLSVKGIPADTLGFISNLVGAEAVGIIGNKRSLDKSQLIRSITSFLTERL
jgi:bifunctional ADP-heptose synthase (sugar kinase/adenylyltransferase)